MPCSRSHPRFSTGCTPGAAPRTRQVPNARAVLSFMRRELLLMFVAGACWACRAALVHAPGCPDPCSLGDVYCNGRSHERLRGESGIVRGLCGAVLGARGRVVGRVFGAGGLDWGRWRNWCCRGWAQWDCCFACGQNACCSDLACRSTWSCMRGV